MPTSPTVKLPVQLVRQLQAFRRRLRTVKILEAICLAGLAVILSYVFLYVSDRVWETPPTLGWILFICAVAGLLTFIPWWSFRWVWQRRTATQLARLIGKNDAALGDRLLGVIELDSEMYGHQYSSEKLKEAAMEQVAREVAGQDLTVNIPRPRHRILFLLLSILVLCTGALCIVSPEAAENALHRWLQPFNPPDATPSRNWIPPPTPWSSPWGKAMHMNSGWRIPPSPARKPLITFSETGCASRRVWRTAFTKYSFHLSSNRTGLNFQRGTSCAACASCRRRALP